MRGFARSNLLNMRPFAKARPDIQIVQRAVGQLPWGHDVALLNKLDGPSIREWYAIATIEHAWTRTTGKSVISSRVHGCRGDARI